MTVVHELLRLHAQGCFPKLVLKLSVTMQPLNATHPSNTHGINIKCLTTTFPWWREKRGFAEQFSLSGRATQTHTFGPCQSKFWTCLNSTGLQIKSLIFHILTAICYRIYSTIITIRLRRPQRGQENHHNSEVRSSCTTHMPITDQSVDWSWGKSQAHINVWKKEERLVQK